MLEVDAAVDDEDDDGVVLDDVPLPASRLRNAVTSVLVLTMPTTSQPSADFSVSFTANWLESYEEALTVLNSCGMGRRLVATVGADRTLTRCDPPSVTGGSPSPRSAAWRGRYDGITSALTSVSDGGPS